MIHPPPTSPPAAATPRQVLIVLGGDLDVASAPGVRARLGGSMGGRGTTVVIDLSAVSFIDSWGLRELVAARARLLTGGRTVLVRSPSPAVLRLLRWTAGHDALGLVAGSVASSPSAAAPPAAASAPPAAAAPSATAGPGPVAVTALPAIAVSA